MIEDTLIQYTIFYTIWTFFLIMAPLMQQMTTNMTLLQEHIFHAWPTWIPHHLQTASLLSDLYPHDH